MKKGDPGVRNNKEFYLRQGKEIRISGLQILLFTSLNIFDSHRSCVAFKSNVSYLWH